MSLEGKIEKSGRAPFDRRRLLMNHRTNSRYIPEAENVTDVSLGHANLTGAISYRRPKRDGNNN